MENRVSLKSLMEENDYSGTTGEEIVEIPLADIVPNPYQPRYVFDDDKIEELANSIKEHGVFQPIIVKKMGENYAIISGERRYRACQKAGLKTIPAIKRLYEKSKMIEIALIENLQREGLTPIEEAKAYQQIINELGYTQQELSIKVGKSRSHITNMLGLLNLPEDVIGLVDGQRITMGHARALSKLVDENKIRAIAKSIVDKGLSVRQTEALAQEERKKNTFKKDPLKEYESYESAFKSMYKGNMKVSDKKIVINVDSFDKIEDILKKLLK